MNIYFASQLKELNLLVSQGVDNILISFAFCKTPEKIIEKFQGNFPKRLIIDSGAFSVWSKDQIIDIDSYINFCKKLKQILPNQVKLDIVNLDVLPGKFGVRPTQRQREDSVEQGWKNMLYMESKGLKVIHVFHQHESFEWLDKIRNHSDYIGISPANDVSMKEKLNWLNKVFSILKNNIKTHGFAVTSEKQLYQYPFYSVDSSSWSASSRFGKVATFNHKNELKSFSYKQKKEILNHWDSLKDKFHFLVEEKNEKERLIQGIKSYLELQKNTTKLWDKRGIVWN